MNKERKTSIIVLVIERDRENYSDIRLNQTITLMFKTT